ncbi:hypothetical protein [Vibrio crassostreae]|uniref:hypothetical protein n=1 Tax=Vibrio crassostreae TaxID=246167 RepID=UPI000631FAA5|nr:hypothetical protein [Vibrio crassostreae]TCO05904.1 hypothetical protein EDB30_102488 [Vibrio crassostreae]TCT50226.1 hypothetical protein EDB42_10849 [Vibrio crassostreae]TCT63157.1 hypothetical protein EDB31_1324 [Vibrio crassostreae]TCT75326.1 hypothetical protein EDB41_108109 [Vibrio crassostreae]TCT94249.1 hypothetical protein EDB38_10949 [Vibrio crassostreae]
MVSTKKNLLSKVIASRLTDFNTDDLHRLIERYEIQKTSLTISKAYEFAIKLISQITLTALSEQGVKNGAKKQPIIGAKLGCYYFLGVAHRLSSIAGLTDTDLRKLREAIYIANAIINDSFRTGVQFRLPADIRSGEVSFQYDDKKFNVTFEPLKIGGMLQAVQIADDAYGLGCNTGVAIITNKIVPDYKLFIEAFNHFLDCYRVAINSEWVNNISIRAFPAIKLDYFIGNQLVNSGQYLYPSAVLLGQPRNPTIETSAIQRELDSPTTEIWRRSYLDSKLAYELGKYDRAILDINRALESFIEIEAPKYLLQNGVSQDEVDEFFRGRNYDVLNDFYKDLISEEDFNQKLNSDKTFRSQPSVNATVKRCNKAKRLDLVPNKSDGHNLRKLNSLIYKIRNHRNDIAHGRDFDKVSLKSHFPLALSSFEGFIELWT